MKVTAKKEYDAVQFMGDGESLLDVLRTFGDAMFKVIMDDGKIDLMIKAVASKPEFIHIYAGNYLVFEGDRYAVYPADSFIRLYGTSESELADQEIAAKDPKEWKSGGILDDEPDWTPFNENRINVGSDGTRWVEAPIPLRWTPDLPTEEQF